MYLAGMKQQKRPECLLYRVISGVGEHLLHVARQSPDAFCRAMSLFDMRHGIGLTGA